MIEKNILLEDERLNIIPINENEKIPAIKWKDYQNKKYPRKILKKWSGNFAVVCGEISNNLVVLDFDDFKLYDKFFDDIQTYTVRTPNGGIHIYLFSKKEVAKTVKWYGYPIDIQGESSYALCLPSSINEKKYEVIKDLEILEVDDVFVLLKSRLPQHKRDEDLEDFKRKINISDIIEHYVHPTGKGKGYWQGLCPFHNDTNPSLTVYKDSFYCFGCQQSGDVISFIEKKENINFKDAIRKIEELSGIKYFKPIMRDNSKYFSEKGKFIPKFLADEIMNEYRFVTHKESEEIFVYMNGVYRPHGEPIIREETRCRLGDSAKTNFVNEVVEHIRESTYTEPEKFIPPKQLLNLENGILDLITSDLKSHSPDFIFINKLPINYDPDASCKEIERFLSEVVVPEDAETLKEFMGYCLYRSYTVHKALMLVGDGANGKSTFLELIASFLGRENVSHTPLQDLDSNRFASASLYGKVANIYADLPDRALFATGKFKMLTGGDEIPAEKKFGHGFTFINFAKLLFSCNKLPEVRDDSSAFFRRWIIINFPNVFEGSKADRNILKKLTTPEELSGLLTLVLKGLKRLLTKGDFLNVLSTDKIREMYDRMSSPLLAFIQDNILQDSESWVSKDEFYSKFVEYCKKKKLPIKAKNAVGMNIGKHLGYIKEERKIVDGVRVRGWRGITFGKDIKIDEHVSKLGNLSLDIDSDGIGHAVQDVHVPPPSNVIEKNEYIYKDKKKRGQPGFSDESSDDNPDDKLKTKPGQPGHINKRGKWMINHYKNHKGIPKDVFVNDVLMNFSESIDPEKIREFYDMLKQQEKEVR